MNDVFNFNVTRVATTAATQVITGPGYAVARLYSGTSAAVTLSLHDGIVTSAATRIALLSTKAIGAVDELDFGVRFQTGLKVKLSSIASSSEGFVGHA